jgi:hypothetical protein
MSKYIIMINGSTGVKDPGTGRLVAKHPGDAPFEVADPVATRLVKLGVAEYADGSDDDGSDDGGSDEDGLSSLTKAQIAERLDEIGAVYDARATKDVLLATLQSAIADDDDGSDDGGSDEDGDDGGPDIVTPDVVTE